MDTETGRRLAPLASAAAVGTLIIGISQLSGGGSGGPGPEPVVEHQRPTPTAAVTRPLDFSGISGLRQSSRRNATTGADPVRIDSRAARGRLLTLNYTITVRGCSSRIADPAVVESARAVTVTLHRLKPQPGQRQVCPEISLANSVEVRLHAPLGRRPVLDGGRAGTLVPPSRANGPTYPPR